MTASEFNHPGKKISQLVKELREYTIFHFSTEEKLFKKYDYPGYQKHKEEHETFIKKVQDFEDRYKSGKLLLSVEITNFIKDWVANHICQTDKKYSDFLLSKGVR